MPDYAATAAVTNNYDPPPPTTTSRRTQLTSKIGVMRSGGEIVQVQGGHIIRATGRKDRHSKVYTAKGPRDRRVRLSAHTAIQFYDVQDRLGYDRPSKAVDWLMNKAKHAIDKLEHLPPFDPTRNLPQPQPPPPLALLEYPPSHAHHRHEQIENDDDEDGEDLTMPDPRDRYDEIQQQIQHHQQQQMGNDGGLSLDSQHSSMVAETMRSFFPTSSTTDQMNSIGFHQTYDPTTHHHHHHHQDLGLSLHTFNGTDPVSATAHTSFPSQFDSTHTEWGVDQNQPHHNNQSEMGRFSRLLAWSCGGNSGGFGTSATLGGGNSNSSALLFGDSRETLQSSFTHQQQQQQHQNQNQHQSSSIRAWDDLPPQPILERHQNQNPITGHGFMTGFCIPTQVPDHVIDVSAAAAANHGYNSNSNKESSMSTDSSH